MAKKISPLTRPLSSMPTEYGISAKHEGKPTPKENPHIARKIAAKSWLNMGKIIGSNVETTPKRTHAKRKRTLLTFSAIIDPSIIESKTTRKSSHRKLKIDGDDIGAT
jgi:hypothetical protein